MPQAALHSNACLLSGRWSAFVSPGGDLLQAAGAIHGDFERGFICAEVMKYDELKELGSESAVKVSHCTLYACPPPALLRQSRGWASRTVLLLSCALRLPLALDSAPARSCRCFLGSVCRVGDQLLGPHDDAARRRRPVSIARRGRTTPSTMET